MAIEQCTFDNSYGRRLAGLLEEPANASLGVVFCHGLYSDKDSGMLTRLAPALASQGIATLRFDFHGHGESDGAPEDVRVTEAIDDATRAIAYMRSRGISRIGIIGSSVGGTAAMFAAERAERAAPLEFLVLRSGVVHYDPKDSAAYQGMVAWRNAGYRPVQYRGATVKQPFAFIEDALQYDGYELASRLRIPTLVVHGTLDPVVPYEQAVAFASLSHAQLVPIHGADHGCSRPEHFEECINALEQFIMGFK